MKYAVAAILAVCALCVTADIPDVNAPVLEKLPLNSDLIVVKALQVVASRISRGQQGSNTGFKLLKAYVNQRIARVSKNIDNLQDIKKKFQSNILTLNEFKAASQRDLADTKDEIKKVKDIIKKAAFEGSSSTKAMAEINAYITKFSKKYSLIETSFIEEEVKVEKNAAVPEDPKDTELQALKHNEQSAASQAKAAQEALEKASRQLQDAKEKERLSRLKYFETQQKKLEHIAHTLKVNIRQAAASIEKYKDAVIEVKKAIHRHKQIVSICNKLLSKLEEENDNKLKIYEQQLSLVKGVSEALKLGVNLEEFTGAKATEAPTHPATQAPVVPATQPTEPKPTTTTTTATTSTLTSVNK